MQASNTVTFCFGSLRVSSIHQQDEVRTSLSRKALNVPLSLPLVDPLVCPSATALSTPYLAAKDFILRHLKMTDIYT